MILILLISDVGSVLVQLLPYSVNHKCSFQSTALTVGVHYQVRIFIRLFVHLSFSSLSNSCITCFFYNTTIVRLKMCYEYPHSSHYTISHHISSHLISSHLISSHLISSHLISSHLISSHLLSSHLITSHHISSHHISSHLISSHLILCHPSFLHSF